MMLKVFMQIRTKGIQAHRFGDNVPPPLKHACWCACIITLKYWLLYNGKFLWGSFFAEGQGLLFQGFNFCRRAHSRSWCTVQLSLFRGFNFHDEAIIRENWTTRNFPLYGMCMILYQNIRFY